MQIIKTTTKTTKVKSNNRSADITMANVVYSCPLNCFYCYGHRNNPDRVLRVYTNWKEIVQKVFDWVEKQPWPKIPNQVSDKYYMVDICNYTELGLTWKYQEWDKIVEAIVNHPKLGITFATTSPSQNLDKWRTLPLDYNLKHGNIKEKFRVRISLMPQVYSNILEPNTDRIRDKIDTLKYWISSDIWQVHYSFAPIIATTGWSYVYDEFLANCVNDKRFKSECIFMTLSEDQLKKLTLEGLIKPEHFELKQSTHGRKVYRYNWKLKKKLIKTFKSLHNKHLPDVDIRYIF